MTNPEAIRRAYIEGFVDGADHGNLPYKYPPLAIAWLISESRRGPLSQQEVHLIEAWRSATYLESKFFQGLRIGE
jgi:hypothetical protein